MMTMDAQPVDYAPETSQDVQDFVHEAIAFDELSIRGEAFSEHENPEDDVCDAWFLKAMHTLSHFDPSSVVLSYKIDADQPLYRLTLWLEDRVIRAWDLNARDNLRTEFWLHIDKYLEDVECPETLFRPEASPLQHWRYDAERRVRVVYWLVSCAISEAYHDTENSEVGHADKVDSEDVVPEWSQKDFPLGFSTGDDQIDRILTILRFQFLLQLQDEQARLDAVVTELQLQRQKTSRTKPQKTRRRR